MKKRIKIGIKIAEKATTRGVHMTQGQIDIYVCRYVCIQMRVCALSCTWRVCERLLSLQRRRFSRVLCRCVCMYVKSFSHWQWQHVCIAAARWQIKFPLGINTHTHTQLCMCASVDSLTSSPLSFKQSSSGKVTPAAPTCRLTNCCWQSSV